MTGKLHSWIRFLVVVALLGATALYLQARNRPEKLPARQELAAFPRQVGSWVGQELGISPDVLEVLGPGEFLSRIYRRAPDEPPVDLFLAYFPSQRTGDTIHSPKNCLPGAGWTPLESSRLRLSRPNAPPLNMNRYIIGQGPDRMLVLYWYQSHGRAVASEYWAKFFLVADAIRLNRTDGALVRVLTPLLPGEDASRAERRAIEFTEGIVPILEKHVPS